VAQARIDFFQQGATVSRTTSIVSSATVPVFDTGSFYDGAFAQAGLGGPIFQVTSVGSQSLVLSNWSGISTAVEAGTRLIMLSARPNAYQDALGAVALGWTVVADSGGRVRAFLPEGRYDYIVSDPSDPAVSMDSPTSNTISGATNSLTIAHTVASDQSALLVAIAWQESTVSETLDSVEWDGTPMTLLAAGPFVNVYYLLNPDPGSHSIVATWSGSSTKAAYGEAFTVANANADLPLGAVAARSGSGTTAGNAVAGMIPQGLVLGAIGVNAVAGTTTASLVAGPTSLWNANVGSTGASTSTRAAGAVADGVGTAANIAWTLNASRAWGSVSWEVLPVWNSLITNVEAGACGASTFGIMATDYSSLQAAIDALPANGGQVFVPAGPYRLTSGIVIAKPNVTLMGEGINSLITQANPADLPVDLITVLAQRTRIINLRLDVGAEEADFTDGKCGLVFIGEDAGVPSRLIQNCYLENVVVNNASKYGVWIRDTIIMTSINCEFTLNLGGGVRIQSAEEHGVCSELLFLGCSMSNNGGIGIQIGDSDIESGMDTITLLNCTIEQNGFVFGMEELEDIGVELDAKNCYQLDVRSCFFEAPPEHCVQMVRFESCPSTTMDSCVMAGADAHEGMSAHGAVFLGCGFIRCSGNVFEDFATDVLFCDELCDRIVEFCNRDLNADPIPRIVINARQTVSMSKFSLSLPRLANDDTLPSPSTVQTGSMIWLDEATDGKHLWICDGTSWLGY